MILFALSVISMMKTLFNLLQWWIDDPSGKGLYVAKVPIGNPFYEFLFIYHMG
jgi:hypothetical protein